MKYLVEKKTLILKFLIMLNQFKMKYKLCHNRSSVNEALILKFY